MNAPALLAQIDRGPIAQALALLPAAMKSAPARIELLAIGLQESRLTARRQFGNGPARGLWQFEAGGGVRGVMRHEASRSHAIRLCQVRGIPFNQQIIWSTLEHDDVLAAGFARLLLWTDPRSLAAAVERSDAAWGYYVRNWRPGRPHPQTWDAFYTQARDYVLNSEK